jgi:hypothetical protein
MANLEVVNCAFSARSERSVAEPTQVPTEARKWGVTGRNTSSS